MALSPTSSHRSLPSEWIIGPDAGTPGLATGGLRINLTNDGYALYALAPTGHAFRIDLQTASPKFSFTAANGSEFRVDNDASTYLYGRDDQTSNPWLQMFFTQAGGQKVATIDLRSDAVNRQTIYDNTGNPVFQVRTDGSVHVKTGAATAMVADL